MRHPILAAAAALILALTLALPASAGVRRPMYGQFSGSAIGVDQRCGPGALTIGFAISGAMTHLGHVSGGGNNCTEFTLATDAVAIWDGLVILEAADGSTLRTTYEGGQGVPAAGVATFSHGHTVIGGSGRFQDAAGALTVSGQIDLTTLTVTGIVSGWVSY
jgi:hypothetical protein